MKAIALVLVVLIAAAPALALGAPVVASTTTTAPAPAGATPQYVHNDCVGIAPPVTTAPHATHTTRVNGFAFSGRLVHFDVAALTLLGNGICPTTQSGPVLPQDFTGTWHMTAVCRGTLNDGATNLDWEVGFVAGSAVSQASGGTPCSGYANNAFSYDVTIEISSIAVQGVVLPPLGGVMLTITQ